MVTLRVDFVGRCGEIVIDEAGHRLDSVAYNEAHRVFLSQMGPEELRAAIEKPAQVVGLELEEGLVLRMIQDVRGEPGALPVLAGNARHPMAESSRPDACPGGLL